jgi:hypothetical protein
MAILLIAAAFKLEENAVVNPIEILDIPFVPFPFPISKPLIDPVTPKLPVIWADPVNGNAAPPPPPATAKANEAVPKSEPVIPADTLSDPVIFEDPSEKNPFFILNSFGISFPYPRVC